MTHQKKPHPHAEMIKAKADDMELVLFCKNSIGDWFEYGRNGMYCPFHEEERYFLCLPKHKEACLHWLNGGDVQNNISNPLNQDAWVPFCRFDSEICEPWSVDCNFMRDQSNFRIKPRKETRHVVIHNGRLVGELFKFDSDIGASYGAEYHELQILKIEVEV